MRLLLDTHIWVWTVLDPTRLSVDVRSLLRSHTATLFLSPISIWEVGLLSDRGRLALRMEVDKWIPNALSRVPILEAPVTVEVARESRRVALPHRDPADRFLAATAKVYGLTLVTSDAQLLGCPDIEVLPNR